MVWLVVAGGRAGGRLSVRRGFARHYTYANTLENCGGKIFSLFSIARCTLALEKLEVTRYLDRITRYLDRITWYLGRKLARIFQKT